MVKKKQLKARPPLSHHQLSHKQQQDRRQHIFLGVGLAVILSVFGLVGFGLYQGWYLPDYKPMHQTVIEVNGHKYNMAYFINALNFYTGGDPTYAQVYVDPVAQVVQDNELIRENAGAADVSVSEADVTTYISDNQLPSNSAVRDIVRGQLLADKLKTDYFAPKVPATAEERQVLAMALESQTQAEDILAQLNSGADFGTLAAANSLDTYTKDNNGDLGWRPQGVLDGLLSTTVMDSYVFSAPVGPAATVLDTNYSKSLGYWLLEVTEKNTDGSQVHVLGMLLSSQEQADEVLAKLAAGGDWGTLVLQYSQVSTVKTDKGDWGFLTSSQLTQVAAGYAFAADTQLGVVSPPLADTSVSTTGACWVVEVQAVDPNRTLTDDDKSSLTDADFNTWLTGLENDPANKLVNNLTDDMRNYAIAAVTGTSSG